MLYIFSSIFFILPCVFLAAAFFANINGVIIFDEGIIIKNGFYLWGKIIGYKRVDDDKFRYIFTESIDTSVELE